MVDELIRFVAFLTARASGFRTEKEAGVGDISTWLGIKVLPIAPLPIEAIASRLDRITITVISFSNGWASFS